MEQLSLVLRYFVEMIITGLASIKLMESFFYDLPSLNYLFCNMMLSMVIFGLLLSYESKPIIKKKRPLGNYFKEQ